MSTVSDVKESGTPAQGLSAIAVYGIPLPIFLVMMGIVAVATYLGVLSVDMTGTIALLLSMGYFFGTIGDRIPIWKDWIGGGNVLAFMGTAYLVYASILPAKYVKSITTFMEKPFGFLDFFVC